MAEPRVKFTMPWRAVEVAWIDFECTGLTSRDRVCQVGIARFRFGQLVASIGSFIDPLRTIPPEATAIHGIVDADVAGGPQLLDFFERRDVVEILKGAQPAAYNAPFDSRFAPAELSPHEWPWLDCLSYVRFVDRYAKGKGRHRLAAACERHQVTLLKAHDAESDAVAAGRLFERVAPKCINDDSMPIGEVLRRQGVQERNEWARNAEWRANQPPLPEQGATP